LSVAKSLLANVQDADLEDCRDVEIVVLSDLSTVSLMPNVQDADFRLDAGTKDAIDQGLEVVRDDDDDFIDKLPPPNWFQLARRGLWSLSLMAIPLLFYGLLMGNGEREREREREPEKDDLL